MSTKKSPAQLQREIDEVLALPAHKKFETDAERVARINNWTVAYGAGWLDGQTQAKHGQRRDPSFQTATDDYARGYSRGYSDYEKERETRKAHSTIRGSSKTGGPSVPTTPRQWQLYSDMEYAKTAAKELTTAAKAAAKELKTSLKGVSSEDVAADLIWQIFDRVLRPVMRKWADVGASDTEPRYEGGQFLVNVAKHEMGIPQTQWTNLGKHL